MQAEVGIKLFEIVLMQKSDDISDLGGFFKNNTVTLSTAELCEPVQLN
jgi:hypothetical protein